MLRSCLPPIFCVWASSHKLSGFSICSNGMSTDDLLDSESPWFCLVQGFGSVFLFGLFCFLSLLILCFSFTCYHFVSRTHQRMCPFRLWGSMYQELRSKPCKQNRGSFGLEAMEELVKSSFQDPEPPDTSPLTPVVKHSSGHCPQGLTHQEKRSLLPQLLVERPREGLLLAGCVPGSCLDQSLRPDS